MDWPEFLDASGIHYVERGGNVSKGNVAVKCPWCGSEDPSEHLNISLHDKGWYCLRNRQHSGKSDARLVQGLLSVTYEQALSIVQGGRVLPADFLSQVERLLGPPADMPVTKPLHWPVEFKPLDPKRMTHRPFLNYLRGRNYSDKQIDNMWKRWDLAVALRGPFANRIIFPIYFEDRLVTWTGRTISPNQTLRYKTLSADPEKAAEEGLRPALGPVSNYLLFWDEIIDCNAHTIIMCEGPFDALRIMHLGRARSIVATCFFTAQPGPAQVDLLHELLPRFDRRYLLLDEGTWATSMRVGRDLAALQVARLDLPSGTKDPDLLTVGGLVGLV